MKHNKLILTIFIVLLALTSCTQMFQPKLPMDTESSTSLGSMLAVKEEISQLETPKQVFVSQGQNPTDILLSWDAVKGATSYTIERAIITDPTITTVPDESEFEIIKKFVYDTTYTDEVLTDKEAHYQSEAYTNNYKYYYRIVAQNPRTSYDPSLPTEPVYGTLFNPVLRVNADLGKTTDSITVYWDEVPNAKTYQIWRGVNSNGTGMELIANVNGTKDNLTQKLFYKNKVDFSEQGIEFYYKVIPVNESGIESVSSPLAMGFSLMAGAPVAPSTVTVSNGRGTKNSIEISWSTVTADGDVKYAIYRTSSVDSSLTQLTADCVSTTFTDSKALKPNVYYYYQVQSYIIDEETGEKLKSPMSDTGAGSKNQVEGFILSAPTSIQVDKTQLSWLPAIGNTEEQSLYTYNIYLSANEKDGYTLDETVSLTPSEDGRIYHNVKIAEFYKISTVYNGIESALSEAVAPSPEAATNVVASQNKNIGSSYYPNANGVYPVQITWKAPAENSLSGYNVYRSTKPDSGFRKINETPILHISGTKDYSFIDENETAKTRTYYYYKVLSVNSLEQGSEYSSTEKGYGALSPEQYMREYNKTAINSQTKLTLMHKSNDMDKLGSETANGSISGTLSYNAKVDRVGARITMHYDNYADYYIIDKDKSSGVYFLITGDTNTSANMSANGTMDGTVVCKGMYPGKVIYDKIQIKGGAAGGGTYGIIREGFDGQVQVDWKVGEEGR